MDKDQLILCLDKYFFNLPNISKITKGYELAKALFMLKKWQQA